MAFAGLTADARVMIDRVRTECQQHRLTVEDAVTVEYITCFLGRFFGRFILQAIEICITSEQCINLYLANLKQRYTQSNGRRPFGISALVVGFDPHTKKVFLL